MSDIKVTPRSLKGEVNIPPSKSISHRAIISASLSKGRSEISNVAFSDDIVATLEAMKSLGVEVVSIDKETEHTSKVVIDGRDDLKLINA